MPISLRDGKDEATAWLTAAVGSSGRRIGVLDVGAGAGVWAWILRPALPDATFTAVEIWEPYIDRYRLRQKYDVVHRAEALATLTAWRSAGARFDVTILGDLVEHFARPDGMLLVSSALAISRYVLLALPIVEWPQGPEHGNPHEAHLAHYTDAEVRVRWGRRLVRSHLTDQYGTYLLDAGC